VHNQLDKPMGIVEAGYRTLIDALESAPDDRLFVLEWHDENEHSEVTFGEFRRRAGGQASFLKHQGVRCGDRIVLVMPQGIELMIAFVGSMMLGAVPAILGYPNPKVEPEKYRSGLKGVTANLSAPFVIVDANFPQELIGCVSRTGNTKLLRFPGSAKSAGELDAADRSIHSQDLAFIQHSSGTTGLQKGVALSHAAVLRQLDHLSETLKISAADCIYSWLPLYHDMGLIACFMLPMVCHLSVVMQAPGEWVQRPETMLKLIHDYRCTMTWLPNFAFQFVPRRTPEGSRSQYDLSSIRAVINCSEPVKTQSMDEFYEAFSSQGLKRQALQSSYAMAENVFAVTQSVAEGPRQIYADTFRFRNEQFIHEASSAGPDAISFTSSGRLLPQSEARIVSETGETLPSGRVGEILIKSDSLFEGYYNRPDLTAQAMADGWYCTGDLGFFHDGELFVVGRKKDLLIVGGENIYPQDVEEIVSGHPAIHDGRVVAIGLFNSDLGTEDVAVVAEVESHESLQDTLPIEREIRASVLAQLGVAVRFVFLKPPKWVVKSTAGKPARSATREKLFREHSGLQR
jgi:acyl-CoA synthetase (AMP-forming)/AMP-acid ligase II